MLKLRILNIDGANPWYETAAQVLRESIHQNSPGMDCEIHGLRIPSAYEKTRADNARSAKHLVSAVKMQWQRTVIAGAESDDVIGFLDADMLCMRDLSPISDIIVGHDLAITAAVQNNKFKWNTGAVFARASQHVCALYDAWADTAAEMMADWKFHSRYSAEYGGVSQSSLAHVLHNTSVGMATRVVLVPTSEWNALNTTHRDAKAEPRLVHLIGKLREYLAQNTATPKHIPMYKYTEEWRKHRRAIA